MDDLTPDQRQMFAKMLMQSGNQSGNKYALSSPLQPLMQAYGAYNMAQRPQVPQMQPMQPIQQPQFGQMMPQTPIGG